MLFAVGFISIVQRWHKTESQLTGQNPAAGSGHLTHTHTPLSTTAGRTTGFEVFPFFFLISQHSLTKCCLTIYQDKGIDYPGIW